MGPLVSRAWVLQEHVLRTRLLHYTATELVFECKSSHRCECMPTSKLCLTTPSLIPKAVAERRRKPNVIWIAWQRLVVQYSKRDLTIANDKLPAISGIAKKIHDATKSTYIAGLWKDNLFSDLLRSTSDTDCSSLDTYRAPTFSWASLNVPVSYYTPDAEEQETSTSTIKLISASVSPTGLNVLGIVSDASLRLRGPCLSAILSSAFKGDKWDYTLLTKGTSAIQISHDCLLVENGLLNGSRENVAFVRRARLGEVPSQFKVSVWCLSAARYDTWISGLVLGKSKRVSGAWERLGTFAAGTEVFQKSEEKTVQIV